MTTGSSWWSWQTKPQDSKIRRCWDHSKTWAAKHQGSATQHAHLTIYVTQPAFKQPFFFLCLGLGGRGEPLKGKPQKKQGGIIGFSWRPERKQKTIAAETLVTWSQASVVSTILYCVVLIAQSVFPFENPTPWPSTRAPFNHGFFRRWFLLSLLTALVFGSSKPSWRICLFNTFTHWWPGWFGFFKAWEKGAYRCLDI